MSEKRGRGDVAGERRTGEPGSKKTVPVGLALGGALVACVLGLLALWPREPSVAASRHLTDVERGPPASVTREGHEVLVDRALGFEILAPEGLTRVDDAVPSAHVLSGAPELAENMAVWRWARPAGGSHLVVAASVVAIGADEGGRRRSFRTAVEAGLRRLGDMGLEIREDRRVAERERLVRAASASNGATMVIRSIGYESHGRSLVVVASGTTLGTTELDEVVESLRAIE